MWKTIWQDMEFDQTSLGQDELLASSLKCLWWSRKEISSEQSRETMTPVWAVWTRILCIWVTEKFYLQLLEYRYFPLVMEVNKFLPWIDPLFHYWIKHLHSQYTRDFWSNKIRLSDVYPSFSSASLKNLTLYFKLPQHILIHIVRSHWYLIDVF